MSVLFEWYAGSFRLSAFHMAHRNYIEVFKCSRIFFNVNQNFISPICGFPTTCQTALQIDQLRDFAIYFFFHNLIRVRHYTVTGDTSRDSSDVTWAREQSKVCARRLNQMK